MDLTFLQVGFQIFESTTPGQRKPTLPHYLHPPKLFPDPRCAPQPCTVLQRPTSRGGFVLKVEMGGRPRAMVGPWTPRDPAPLDRPTQKCSRAHSDTLLSWRSLASSRRSPTTQSQLFIPQLAVPGCPVVLYESSRRRKRERTPW